MECLPFYEGSNFYEKDKYHQSLNFLVKPPISDNISFGIPHSALENLEYRSCKYLIPTLILIVRDPAIFFIPGLDDFRSICYRCNSNILHPIIECENFNSQIDEVKKYIKDNRDAIELHAVKFLTQKIEIEGKEDEINLFKYERMKNALHCYKISEIFKKSMEFQIKGNLGQYVTKENPEMMKYLEINKRSISSLIFRRAVEYHEANNNTISENQKAIYSEMMKKFPDLVNYPNLLTTYWKCIVSICESKDNISSYHYKRILDDIAKEKEMN